MEGHCSTGQSPQWAVVRMEEEEEEAEEEEEEEEEGGKYFSSFAERPNKVAIMMDPLQQLY